MIKIASVWEKEKEGKTFYSGKIDLPCSVVIDSKLNIFIFPNKSDHEQSPTYDVLLGKPKPKEEE